ncbi:hypothetical protein N7468_002399 [Penicillium chermesinum]|uniref:cyclin-dependent kinase n=1 Tax=Penicillium chermesinum TaxID=63820 RepID=A0A9W9TXH7_9EURO|nr:uncharacterized protein N7468_002399 [Penicillium chermesinum]KAJ5247416.1 hypothetical protein N7468_002399 [Penicillium chermesinum]
MDWQKSLGFTDRLRAIQSLTTAFQQTASSAAYTEAQNKARQLESEAYSQAKTKDEYDQTCQKAIDAAESAAGGAKDIDVQHDDEFRDPDVSSDPVGEKIGPYLSCFHHFDGLHSRIYRTKADDGSLRAVKIMTPHMMMAPHDGLREVRLLKEASGDHVIRLIETFKLEGGRIVLVFPFLRYDLERLLRRDAITANQTRSVLRDLFSGLAHCHKLGIIHRDIKPSNILLDSPDGPAYVADFGISWKEGDPGCEPSDSKITDVGTTCYRPPEILFGYTGYGTSLDLWAAGCVVAEATSVGHRALFDSGPVGSDLSLIQSIFQTLGTPNEHTWPGVHVLPDWGKVEFHPFPAQAWGGYNARGVLQCPRSSPSVDSLRGQSEALCGGGPPTSLLLRTLISEHV